MLQRLRDALAVLRGRKVAAEVSYLWNGQTLEFTTLTTTATVGTPFTTWTSLDGR